MGTAGDIHTENPTRKSIEVEEPKPINKHVEMNTVQIEQVNAEGTQKIKRRMILQRVGVINTHYRLQWQNKV